MRLHRFSILFIRVLLLCVAAGVSHGQITITLGATSGNSSSCSLQALGTCNLSARVTGQISDAAVLWSVSPAVSGATFATGFVSGPDGTGLTRNTYTAPSLISTRTTVVVTATSREDQSKSAQAQITLQPPGFTIQVSPATVTLNAGQSQQFTAQVFGISQTGVTWSISGAGTIDAASGLYTAPAVITTSSTVTVTATSTFDNTTTGTATVRLNAPASVGVSVTPSSVTLTAGQTQQFSATVSNASSNAVTWTISPQTGTIDQTGLYTAPAIISVSSRVTVAATSVTDGSKSGSATITLNTTIDVGLGAPTPALQQAFITSFFRNGFSNQVTLPPIGNVTRLGATGYIQTFNGVISGTKLALATASPLAPSSGDGTSLPVLQLYADLYAYYATVGANTAGLPLYDSLNCPAIDSSNSCQYDFFDKSFVLFAYHAPLATGQNFTISGVYYTEWMRLNGIAGLGRPVDVVTNITAATIAPATTGTTGAFQAYLNGAIYNITSGTFRNATFSVVQPIYGLYVNSGGPSGSLGMPTAQEIVLSNGDHRQQFEGGILQYTPGGDGPTQRVPVTSVVLSGQPSTSNTVTLNLGQTLALTATPLSSAGQSLTDRPVSWVTTNSRVIAITPSGAKVTVKAAGGGVASLSAASEGVSSAKLTFIVIAPCCQVGDGATPAVQQSFFDALARNRISVSTPVPSPAARVGNGYVQMMQASDGSGTLYMLAESDAVGAAYVVTGAQLAAYQAVGGPAGTLGYPVSDASAGGTQRFENGAALAGSPVRLVSGGVLAKWTALGSDAGAAGAPSADAAPFSTFGANSGMSQAFAGGVIYAASSGPKSGQTWFVTGLILARYNALGGANGDYGMPASDEFITGGVHQQNFEGGNITYVPGDAAAKEHPAVKVPGIVVSPAVISAGTRARLAIVGFNSNTTLKVSVSGQPDFTVTTANGAFSWDLYFPLNAASGTVTIHAADTRSSAAADGTLTVRGFNTNRIAIAKVQGDNQTGLPGALLPISLRVALKDAAGDPIAGAAVTFQASSGAQVLTPSTVSDSGGMAETFVRLPKAESIALIDVNAPAVASAPVTFGVKAAASSLSNVPKLQEAGSAPVGNGTGTIGQKGALLTAVATMLRYHQNRSELAAPNGPADPVTLNAYLTGYCPADANGNQVCDGYLSNPDSGEQVVNLWRAAQFTGGADVEILPAAGAIADFLSQGSPVLVSLGLSLNGNLVGGHFVVATGVAADGSIAIQDPNTDLARTNLNDYLAGFTTAAGTWKADIRGAARFALRSPVATRFLVAALSLPPAVMQSMSTSITSAAGVCGQTIDLLDAVDTTGQTQSKGALVSRLAVCDGAGSTYQIRVGAAQAFRALVSDLATGGSQTDVSGTAVANYKATRPQLNLALGPQDVSFTAAGVVNGATFRPGISPGGILSIFGSGLWDASAATTVDIDGAALTVFPVNSAFQINAALPASVAPGTHTLRVRSAFGTASQQVTVSAVSPGIFLVGNPPVAAVTNVNYGLIGPTNPLARGQTAIVWTTGLGTVAARGVTTATVTVVLNGVELPVQYAGLSGFTGLYQVNVAVPAAMAPGSGVPLALKVGGQVGNTVPVVIQ